ncbi:early nodulin-75-like [Cucumis melo var. makuwa]|uniref:Early nodulin-75-like n=2 Tax=Cucumis melo TaxID=3656 RepID=A0A5A7TUG4_CUCMM|nr:early nodulin-75-like [Cucumis melo var. makuwa]TYK23577.1 early nodulin-75-like [Cucumis melo var. makuwa]
MNNPYGYYSHGYPYPHKRSYPKYKAAVPPRRPAGYTSYHEYEDYYPYPSRNYQGYPKYDAPTTKAPPPHQCSYHEYEDYYPYPSRNYQGYPKYDAPTTKAPPSHQYRPKKEGSLTSMLSSVAGSIGASFISCLFFN